MLPKILYWVDYVINLLSKNGEMLVITLFKKDLDKFHNNIK